MNPSQDIPPLLRVLLPGILLAIITTTLMATLYFHRQRAGLDDTLTELLDELMPGLEQAVATDDEQALEFLGNLLLKTSGVQGLRISRDDEALLTLGAVHALEEDERLYRYPIDSDYGNGKNESAELLVAEDRSAFLQEAWRSALVLGFVQMVLLLGLVFFLPQRSRRTEAVGVQADDKGEQETGALQKAVITLNDKLKQHQSHMQSVLSERDKLITTLQNQNAELERFSYSISHDLKSPLVTITGFVDLLEKDIADGDAELIARDLMRINEATDTMKALLDDLLKMARFSHPEKARIHVSFEAVLNHVLMLLDARIREKQARVVVDNSLPHVLVDEPRLKEILLNLVGNSLKFSGDKVPEIHIGCSAIMDLPDSMRAEYYVSDNGIGIDPVYHQRVFKLFERLAVGGEGTGMGLALVRRIVENLGGEIRVESEGEGAGCTIRFDLPLENNEY